MKKIFLLTTLLITSLTSVQGKTKKVLFLGNSYTYVNDLPKMINDAAATTGDTLIYDSNTPGSFSLGNHALNTISINLIKSGGWDFVVLQGQSYDLVTLTPETYPFPYARTLDSLINVYNAPCGETVFYMTWGRKNGDPSSCPTIPFLCTYESMDSVIHVNYVRMADSNKALVSPVGAVWRSLRTNYPLIELYQTDESHPTVAGTYAATCCFYSVLFRKDPTLITYNPGIPAADAANIRATAKLVVYDSLLNWRVGKYDSVMNINCHVSTGVDKQDKNVVLDIFPNPATETLTINTNNKKNNAVEIYNAVGILFKQVNVYQRTVINISDIPNGVYFIRLKENTTKVYKFIKQ